MLGEKILKNSVEMTILKIGALNEEVEKGNLTLEQAQEMVKTFVFGSEEH